MNCYLIIGNSIDLKNFPFEEGIKVGIDKGSFKALEAGIKLDYAVGDFDSCTEEEFKLVQKEVKNIIKLKPEKDDSDTLHAIEMFKDYEHIYLLGSMQGKRIEHFLANLILLRTYNNLILLDDYSLIKMCNSNETFIQNEYKFYSFFALEDTYGLTLEGFKYPLWDFRLAKENPLGLSNELVKEEGTLSYLKGKLMVVMTKDDK